MPDVGNLQILLSLWGKIVKELQWLEVPVHPHHTLACPLSEISLAIFIIFKL